MSQNTWKTKDEYFKAKYEKEMEKRLEEQKKINQMKKDIIEKCLNQIESSLNEYINLNIPLSYELNRECQELLTNIIQQKYHGFDTFFFHFNGVFCISLK